MSTTHLNKNVRFFISILLTLLLNACAGTNYAERAQVQQFIEEMSVKHNFDRAQLTYLFNQVKPRPHVVSTMKAPKETSTPWYAYRAIFIQPDRIQQGVEFWHAHATTLAQAEQRYGVPASMIVAILGVETRYGRTQGKESAFNSLATFAFDYPRRAPYFRSELENYLLLTREMSLDPLTLKSSYAGALGQPQFMPSSYRNYAVDATGKGYSNLFSNENDVILSVANYFKAHGWLENQPVTVQARVDGSRYEDLSCQPNKPQMTIAELARYGIRPLKFLPSNEMASFLPLEGIRGQEYWLRLHNFYVITHYNTSPFYAMAVYQLSEKIKERYQRQV